MLVFVTDALLYAVHELHAGEVSLVGEFVAVLELPQVSQLGLHEDDLRTGVGQLTTQNVGLARLQHRETVVEGLTRLDAFLVARQLAARISLFAPLHQIKLTITIIRPDASLLLQKILLQCNLSLCGDMWEETDFR